MNKRLDSAVEVARRALSEAAQEDLAAIVEEFVSGQAVDNPALLAPEEDARLERRLDGSHPATEPEDYDRWFRAKVEKAIREADAHPGRGSTLADVKKTLGLEP